MDSVADVRIPRQKFREQADWFWEALDGKGSYMENAPRLEG
jgi:hypothetical protein